MIRNLIALFLLLAFAMSEAGALTPEEAYAAIPHRRTAFDPGASRLPKAQVESLKRLFVLSDGGVVLRVEGMQAHRGADARELKRVLAQYDTLIESLRALQVVAEVKPAQELILQAIRDQRRFLASRPVGGLRFARNDLAATPDVREASQKLHRAYGVLMQTFPHEPAGNKTSFYDHLCALDYL